MSVVVNRLLICMIWALLVSPVFSFMIPGLGFGMKRRAHSSSSLMISSTGSDNKEQSSCKPFLACVLEIHVYEIHSYDFLLYIHIVIFPIYIFYLLMYVLFQLNRLIIYLLCGILWNGLTKSSILILWNHPIYLRSSLCMGNHASWIYLQRIWAINTWETILISAWIWLTTRWIRSLIVVPNPWW